MNKCCYIWSHAKITAWYTSAYHSSTLAGEGVRIRYCPQCGTLMPED